MLSLCVDMTQDERMAFRFILVFLFLLLLSTPGFAEGKKVIFASSYWPPYTGELLSHDGATSAVIRQAFKAVGYEVEIRFYPWNRTLQEVENNPDIQGYFPEYSGREAQYLYSDAIGKSPVGFAKRSRSDTSWHSYSDLQGYLIGVVSGYVNTERFDELVAAKKIRTEPAVSDLLNLRKLLAQRVDIAVVDMNTFNYLVSADALLYAEKDELRMDHRLLGVNSLHACFNKTIEGRRLQLLLNEGLRLINAREVERVRMERIIDKVRKTKPGAAMH